MSDQLFALRLFIRVAHLRSFSKAARELRLSQPSVSRIIAVLEEGLGVALFTRTTRAVSLTDPGRKYLEEVQRIVDALDAANHAARGTNELSGNLRVAAGSTFAVRAVLPHLPQFLAAHPKLSVDLLVEDRLQDLVAEGVDLAFRFGELHDSSAVSRRLATWARSVVASPTYLERRGVPYAPADLADHHAVGMAVRTSAPWTFRRNEQVITVQTASRISPSISEACLAACVQGLGILRVPTKACEREIESGMLVPLLEDWDVGSVDLNAVFAAGRAVIPSARAFADHMALHIGNSSIHSRSK